jgi:hypothetical protein
MKPLTIELLKGQKQEFMFLGWKDDGLAFYSTKPDGQPAVIVPKCAYPGDCVTGEPYRFPRFVPVDIIPKRFNVVWSEQHRRVLRRWLDAKMVGVDALTKNQLFPFDEIGSPQPSRSQKEIEQKRQHERDGWQRHYNVLAETPLVELLDTAGVLDEFSRGRWADEMGEDFRVMMCEAKTFASDYLRAFDSSGQCAFVQEVTSAMHSVLFVMRGDDKREYPLTSVSVRHPTDQEAESYERMQRLVPGVLAPHPNSDDPITIEQVYAHPGLQVKYGKQTKPMGKKQLGKYCALCGIESRPKTYRELGLIVAKRSQLLQRRHNRGLRFAKQVNSMKHS